MVSAYGGRTASVEQQGRIAHAARNRFSREEYAARVQKLRERMEERGLDAIVVSAPENVFYLCGYHTKAVFTFQFRIVHRARPALLVTRQMEIANAQRAQRDGLLEAYVVYQDDEDPLAAATKSIREFVGEGAKVGMELGSWTMPAQRARAIMGACSTLSWQDVSTLIDRMRLVKSPAELAVLKEAAAITDRVADRACAAVAAGQTEDDVAQVVMAELIAAGSEYPGSWPNIMAGRRTGLIHAAWEGEPIAANDHVLMEITGVKQRYHAPCLRAVFVGEPAAEIRAAAAAMGQAHAAAVAAIEPGRPASVINDAAQAVLSRYDLGCKVARRSGYSLGIGFPPSWGAQWQIGLNSVVDEPLAIGMAFHVVLVGHFDDGRAIGIGQTVALLDEGAVGLTRGGVYEAAH